MDFKKLFREKKLIILCGVGGVGKTTLSAALALRAAESGLKSLVITIDPAKRLAQALNLSGPSPEPVLVRKAKSQKGELHACLLDAKHTFDRMVETHAPDAAREAILSNPLYQQISMMLAGTQEYMAMEKLYSLSSQNRFDCILVDTPPARHAIDFLTAPTRMTHLLNDSLLKWMISPSLFMGRMGSRVLETFSRLTGADLLKDISRLVALSLALVEGFTQRADAIRKDLAGPQTAFFLVSSAGAEWVGEGKQFQADLESLGLVLEGLLLNRMSPPFGSAKEVAEAAAWSRKPENGRWQKWGEILRRHAEREKEIRKTPRALFIPEQIGGIRDFEDIQTLAENI